MHRPRIVADAATQYTEQVQLPQSRVRNQMPGLSVKRASEEPGRRVRFAGEKELSEAGTWRDQGRAQKQGQRREHERPRGRSMLPRRDGDSSPPRPVRRERDGDHRAPGNAGFERSAPPERRAPARPMPSDSDSEGEANPMEPTREIVFSETDSSFSRIANPAKVHKRAKGKSGIPKPGRQPRALHSSTHSSARSEHSRSPQAAPSRSAPRPILMNGSRGESEAGSQGTFSRSQDGSSHLERAGIRERVRHRAEEMRELETEEMQEREQLLYEFHRLEQEGVPMTRVFDRNSDLDVMRFEYHKLTSDQAIRSSVNSAKRYTMFAVGVLEMLNNQFDPFGLKIKISDDLMARWDEDYKPDMYRVFKMRNKYAASNPYTALMSTFVLQFAQVLMSSIQRAAQNKQQPQRAPQQLPPPQQHYAPYAAAHPGAGAHYTQAQMPFNMPTNAMPQQQQAPPQAQPPQQQTQQFQQPQAPPNGTYGSLLPQGIPGQGNANNNAQTQSGAETAWSPAVAAQQAYNAQVANAQQSWQQSQQAYGGASSGAAYGGASSGAQAPLEPGRRRARMKPPQGAMQLQSFGPALQAMQQEQRAKAPVTSVYSNLDTDNANATGSDSADEMNVEISESGPRGRGRPKGKQTRQSFEF